MDRSGIRVPSRAALAAALLGLCAAAAAPGALRAQNPSQPPADSIIAPAGVQLDTVLVTGNVRITAATVRNTAGLRAGSRVTQLDVQSAIRRLMGTGNYESVGVFARGADPARTTLVFAVTERPLISSVEFRGLESASGSAVRDTVGWKRDAPLDPARVVRTESLIRDLLANKGVQLVSIDTSLVPVPGSDAVRLVFDVREGNRLAVAEVDFTGNQAVDDEALRDAIKTRPEGFFWFHSGRFDRETFEGDLQTRLPEFYAERGYIDFRVVSDTLIVDPQTGKARVVVAVEEGPQYRLGEFQVEGNSRFPTEQLARMYTVERRTVLGLPFGGTNERERGEVFDRAALDAATQRVAQLYRNQGYLYAQVEPVVRRVSAADGGAPTVDVTWAISERSPFYVRRVAIEGNTYTHESVIRDRIWVLPGSVYNEEALIQSYQSVAGLGFFETPMPLPDIQPQPDSGVVDIVFRVKEKQTGNINFGTSVGGGYAGYGGGISGFLGYSQPNLFGQGKQANLRVEYGPGRSRFEAGYTDPALWGSRYSGSVSLFHSGDRYRYLDDGRSIRTGGSLQVGAPVPGLLRTRAFVGYSLSRNTLEPADEDECDVDPELRSIFCQDDYTLSSLSLGVTRDTKNSPLFPTAGTRQNLSLEQNGGLLGADGNFQKVTTGLEWWVPAGTLGGGAPGARPIRFAFGLEANGGAVFGDASRFGFRERFLLGGVQSRQPLRGYPEASITPLGFQENCRRQTVSACLGDAYLSLTAQYAARLNDNLSLHLFGDAGNVWSDVGEIDPSRLFRGAGVGATVVTPFGPIGLDAAYGFDRPDPQWELHFRLGQTF